MDATIIKSTTTAGPSVPVVSPAQIRRAAGSNDAALLKRFTADWTASELDQMASEDGKCAVHMAAWQGCIENVRFLLEDKGCNVNTRATGQFSYGKTALFFAATRSRNDVVEYLPDQGAHVKIINNKGQSPLSIASSHLDQTVIRRIQEAEMAQSHLEWSNYRETHSDGLEYGDLDPRFLGRPLRTKPPGEDNVTDLAVNPTTKQSRRGSFYRLNPHLAEQARQRREEKKQKKRQQRLNQRPEKPEWTNEEQGAHDQALDCLLADTGGEASKERGEALLSMMRLLSKRRSSWIPQLAERIRDSSDLDADVLVRSIQGLEISVKEKKWIERLLSQVGGEPVVSAQGVNGTIAGAKKPKTSSKPLSNAACVDQRLLESAYQLLSHLPSIQERVVSETDEGALDLTMPPMWVDASEEGWVSEKCWNDPKVVAMDTEWYTNPQSKQVQLATLQLAVPFERDGIVAIVIDMISTNAVYKERVAQWLKATVFNGETVVIGFAMTQDLRKLRTCFGKRFRGAGRESSLRLLDVQRLVNSTKGRLPSLQTCVATYMNGALLSKEEQCSDWSRRPLSKKQLQYAALDAGVLLLLLPLVLSADRGYDEQRA